MQSKATHPHHYSIIRMARAYAGLLAMALLLLSTSQEAFAQSRVLQQYQALEQAAEEAKERHAVEPTARTLSIMNQALDTFQQFEDANRKAIEQARMLESPRKTMGTGGPDGFGYTYIDSNEPGGPVYSFVDATGGILVARGDDASSINSGIFGQVPLGTAPFNFYGTDYSALTPATNGYISTSAADTGPDLSNDCPIPGGLSSGFGGRIYPVHDDLEADQTADAGIYWDYFASCPHPHSGGGCDVFQWKDANHWPASAYFDYEVIIFDNNDILFQFAPGNAEAGAGSTTGIQNEPITVALQYEICNFFGTLEDNLAVLIEYPDLTQADLELTKTVDNATPEVGEEIVFTITLTNLVGGAAVVRINDLLPDGLAFASATTTQGTYNAGNGDWQVGTIGIGGSPTSSATLTLRATVTEAGTITNTAFVAFSSLPDPDESNNSASATVNPVAADLAISKRVIDFESVNGTILAEFLITIVNQGPNDVCGVEVEDVLSPDMTLLGVSASQGVIVATPPVIGWGVGCLDVGKSATMNARVSVPADGNLINTAEVTASDLPDPDSVVGDGEGDDYALATAAPRSAADFVPEGGPGGIISRGDRFTADLATDKSVNVTSAPIGGAVQYTIAVTNQGPQSTAKVELTDELPDCLTFDGSTADRGSYDGETWTIGKLKVGETVTLVIDATVGPDCSGTVTNTAEVTASSLPDPDDQFNLFDDPPVQDEISSASFDVETTNRELNGTVFALGNNYPNPFNPDTVVPYSLPEASFVTIKVYDLLGRAVATLVDGTMPAGVHEVRFEAGMLPTGMYLVRMEAAGKIYTQRITLMK